MLPRFNTIINFSYFLTEPGVLHDELEEPLGYDDTVIPRHLNPCYGYAEGNAIIQDTIIARTDSEWWLDRSRGPGSNVSRVPGI